MSLAGLDVGDKTIGVAVTDEAGLLSHGLTTLRRQGDKHDFPALRKCLEGRQIERFIVGWPLNMDGTEGDRALKTRRFAQRLVVALGLPVALWDERLSSFEAEERLAAAGRSGRRAKGFIDTVAAQVILESYVAAGAPPGEVP